MVLSVAARNAAINAVTTLVESGAAAPTLELATSDNFSSVGLILTLDSADAFLATAGGVSDINLGAAVSGTATLTDTLTHKRLKDGDGNVITGISEACNAITGLMGGGTLQYCNSDASVIYASYSLGATAFGPAVNGVATANNLPFTTTATAGTATHYRFVDSGGVEVDLQPLPGALIIPGGTLAVNSVTYTVGAFDPVLSPALSVTNGSTYELLSGQTNQLNIGST